MVSKRNNKTVNTSGKYHSLVGSIILFSVLVLSIMSLSFYISNQLDKDNKIINTAFDQTSLVNLVISDLYIIRGKYNAGEPYSEEQERLRETVGLIDSRMQVFNQGGELLTVSTGNVDEGDYLNIDAINDNKGVGIINGTISVWEDYKRRIRPVFSLSGKGSGEVALSAAQDYQFQGSILWNISGLSKVKLDSYTDNIALHLQELSDEKLGVLRLAQIVGMVVTALSLLFIVFYFIRRLSSTDFELEKARQETNGILNTVREGLFLVDEQRIISNEYSNEMEEIFETNNIGGREFTDLLGKIVSPTDLENMKTFVEVLFDPKVIENLIGNLNPLKQIKVSLENSEGVLEDKHLSFNFFRVISRGKIRNVLVSVSDISDRVRLQQELESNRSESEQQIEMLVSFMNANPAALNSFLDNSASSLQQINEILKTPVSGKADFRAKVDQIFIQIHKTKGDASAIGLEAFAEKAHELESTLHDMKYITDIKGMDFLPLTILLDQLISYTDTLKNLSTRRGLQEVMQDDIDQVQQSEQEWQHLAKLVNDVASDCKKEVRFVTSGLSEMTLNDEYKDLINSFCVQLLRNSLVHGIETPEERLQHNKPKSGRIDLRASKLPDGSIELILRDDGRGFDDKKIAENLVAKGSISSEEIAGWQPDQIVKHVFSQGISTADVGMHAGRGVGLNVITEGVRQFGGKLKLQQAVGKFCQFEMTLPPLKQ
ncbi:MAG: ATP-binding protein [Arenicella sp.]